MGRKSGEVTRERRDGKGRRERGKERERREDRDVGRERTEGKTERNGGRGRGWRLRSKARDGRRKSMDTEKWRLSSRKGERGRE